MGGNLGRYMQQSTPNPTWSVQVCFGRSHQLNQHLSSRHTRTSALPPLPYSKALPKTPQISQVQLTHHKPFQACESLCKSNSFTDAFYSPGQFGESPRWPAEPEPEILRMRVADRTGGGRRQSWQREQGTARSRTCSCLRPGCLV